jgi:hypothetical protein
MPGVKGIDVAFGCAGLGRVRLFYARVRVGAVSKESARDNKIG